MQNVWPQQREEVLRDVESSKQMGQTKVVGLAGVDRSNLEEDLEEVYGVWEEVLGYGYESVERSG